MHAMRRLNDEEPTEMMVETKRGTWRMRETKQGSRFHLTFLSQFRYDLEESDRSSRRL